jgi:hypothetical protein
VHVAEPHEMPIDADGNRADIVMDGNSTIGRMNVTRLIEQYTNAAGRDVVKKLRLDLGYVAGQKNTINWLRDIEADNEGLINKAWEYLTGYYAIVSPRMKLKHRIMHLASVLENGIYLYVPTDNEPESMDIITQLEQSYRPLYGPVSYVGYSGKRVTTKNNVLIGSVYIILLEKTGDDWTAVSSGKLQHFGVLSQVTNIDKYSQPSRNQAIRALGESEVRIYAAYVGSEITADIMDRSNNPATHRHMLDNLLRAEIPTSIDKIIDRKQIPLGGAKPNNLVSHIALCGGWEFQYSQHKVSWQQRK